MAKFLDPVRSGGPYPGSREALLPSPMDGDRGLYGHSGRGSMSRGRGKGGPRGAGGFGGSADRGGRCE